MDEAFADYRKHINRTKQELSQSSVRRDISATLARRNTRFARVQELRATLIERRSAPAGFSRIVQRHRILDVARAREPGIERS
jgi:hypothetical protein